MNHEPECNVKGTITTRIGESETTLANIHVCICNAIRAAYKRGVSNALVPVRELANKFEHEDDGNAVLRYRLAAARIWGAIKEGGQ